MSRPAMRARAVARVLGVAAALGTTGCGTGTSGGAASLDASTHDAGSLEAAPQDTSVAGDSGGAEAAGGGDAAPADAGPSDASAAEAAGPEGGAVEGGPVDASDAGPTAWVMGYYYGPDQSLLPVSGVTWSALTHVAAAFYRPQSDGTLDPTLGLDATAGPALASSLVAAAHAHGVLAIASVGGADSQAAFRQATASGTLPTFVASLAALLTQYGYDGIDVDWEPIATSDQPAVLAVASQLRAAHPGVVLTLAVSFTNPNHPSDLSGYPALAAVYDHVDVMTYGMAGLYPGWKSWHTSALHYSDSATPSAIDESVGEYLAAGVPAAKLGFGFSAYGLCYGAPVTGPDQGLGDAQVLTDVSYADIAASYDTPSARQWDPVAAVPYLSFPSPTGPGACGFVSYDDAQSVTGKAAYLREKGLGGVIVWRINRSYTGADSPLLDAVGASFLH